MRSYCKTVVVAFACLFVLALASCGSDDDSSMNLAPASIAGKTYSIEISAGTGVFAPQGTVTIAIDETEDTYEITGDGVNSDDSTGNYTYLSTGNSAAISVQDSVLGEGTFSLAFTGAGTGTYSATVVSDPASSQSGVFTEQ